MTDHTQRLERMDERAMALVDDLQEFLAGRPVDVVVNALTTAAAMAVTREADLSDAEIDHESESAQAFVQDAMTLIVGRARHDRLRFAFYTLHVATLTSALINAEVS